jgi:hypothetical protein
MSNNIEPTIIKLESLEKEYEVVLKQYEEYYNNYTKNLNTNTQTNSTTKFINLKGRTYWGQYGIKEGSVKTIDECQSMCASDLKCTGATFNPSTRYCWARGGNGNITNGNDSDIAIIPKLKQNVIILKGLNDKLIAINAQINNELEKLYPIAENDIQLKNKKQQELTKYYQHLINERAELEETLNEYETIEQQYNNDTLSVVSNNMRLRLWTIICLIFLTITIKSLIGNTDTNINVIFWGIMVILFILLSTNLTTPQGFTMWCILILIIALIKMKIIPSP